MRRIIKSKIPSQSYVVLSLSSNCLFSILKSDALLAKKKVQERQCLLTSSSSSSETRLGYGTGKAVLDCATDQYQNPNWTPGQLYSTTTVTCKPAELQIKATAVEIN
jgi:hypothetical protein